MLAVDQLSEVKSPEHTDEIREKFLENGYVVIRDVLDAEEDIQPVLDEYAEVLDKVVKEWYADGKISSTFDGLDFETRLIHVTEETGPAIYDYFRIFFNPPSATTSDSPIHSGPAIFNFLTNPKVLDVIGAVIGHDIYVNPVNIIRIKPPEARLPKDKKYHIGMTSAWWHQDQGVYADDVSDVDLVTAWIPLTDAFKDMGCLQVVPGSHKSGELNVHCESGDPAKVGIPELYLGPVRHYVEMKKGDVHLHHKLLQHGSLRNISDKLRFSFDLRYQPLGQADGIGSGVPRSLDVPGFVARSNKRPDLVMRRPEAFAQYLEDQRRLFMSIDWQNNPPVSQFTSDHRYCI